MYGTDPSLLLTTYAYTLTRMFAGYVAAGVLNESGLTNLLIKRLSGNLGRVVHPALAVAEIICLCMFLYVLMVVALCLYSYLVYFMHRCAVA